MAKSQKHIGKGKFLDVKVIVYAIAALMFMLANIRSSHYQIFQSYLGAASSKRFDTPIGLDHTNKSHLYLNESIKNLFDSKMFSSARIRQILSMDFSKKAELLSSPACYPHFQLALPNGEFEHDSKFKRLYFYHARKAGGSSLAHYFGTVAKKYGLDYKAVEYSDMEEPGFGDVLNTFYVAHMREPIDRAISHFKYQGRWWCRNLTFNKAFIPTEENAKKLESWNKTGGHLTHRCKVWKDIETETMYSRFSLAECAVNCYTQWFSGLSCPLWNISWDDQYAVAKRRVLRYNLIVVVEKLRDPFYVDAIEKMFNVSGLTKRVSPYCEKQSHKANADIPLLIQNKTRARLVELNALDSKLYDELTLCLNGDIMFNFPKWDSSRFELGALKD